MRYLLLCVLAFVMTSCAAARQTELTPAILPDPSQQQIDTINAVLKQAMPGADLSVNAEAFRETSIVAFERAIKNDMDLTMPLRFQLLTDGESCFLSKMETEQRWKIENLGCESLTK